jgi:acyl-CoA reductase-like NAD-dependent aldehyde dehydrogenase
MKVYNKEIFGPVVSVIRYNDLEDVIRTVNRTEFSFQTSIFTQDIDTAMYYAKTIETKACIINDHTAFRVDWMPFGGAKDSGLHVGGVKYSINDMTEEKLIVIKNYQI